jgi:hypothetical protein
VGPEYSSRYYAKQVCVGGMTRGKATMKSGPINGLPVSRSNGHIWSMKRTNQGDTWHTESGSTSPWVMSTCHVTLD